MILSTKAYKVRSLFGRSGLGLVLALRSCLHEGDARYETDLHQNYDAERRRNDEGEEDLSVSKEDKSDLYSSKISIIVEAHEEEPKQ